MKNKTPQKHFLQTPHLDFTSWESLSTIPPEVTRVTSVLWWTRNTASTQLDQKERGRGSFRKDCRLISYQLKLSLRLRTVLHMKPKLTHECTSYSFMDFWCLFADNGKHAAKILRDVNRNQTYFWSTAKDTRTFHLLYGKHLTSHVWWGEITTLRNSTYQPPLETPKANPISCMRTEKCLPKGIVMPKNIRCSSWSATSGKEEGKGAVYVWTQTQLWSKITRRCVNHKSLSLTETQGKPTGKSYLQ